MVRKFFRSNDKPRDIFQWKWITLSLFLFTIDFVWAQGNCEKIKTYQGADISNVTRRAKQGHADAQYKLGTMCLGGKGTGVEDIATEEAVKWIRKSAEQAYAQAQFELGQYYAIGFGVVKDHKESVKWYRKAAELGHVEAQSSLGRAYSNGVGVSSRNEKEAEKWLLKAAIQGNDDAQLNLSYLYYTRNFPNEKPEDFQKAVEWSRKAAEQGNANAQYSLGAAYSSGQGVSQNYTEAAAWYTKAANQGHPEAKFNLAMMYFKGQGLTQNYIEAYKWIILAAAVAEKGRDYDSIIPHRDRIKNLMTPDQIAKAQNLAEKWKPTGKWWLFPN